MSRFRNAPPYHLLSLALDYPTEPLDRAISELVTTAPRSLAGFLAWHRSTALAERQRLYVETFDLERHTSLHLTFYLYGDTRKRGLALLRLKRLYEAAGLSLETDELPDHLPVMLEFAALAPDGYGETLLAEHRIALELLRLRLQERESPWAPLVEVLCERFPRLARLERERLRRLFAEGPPQEQVGLEPFAPPEAMPHTGARR